MSSTRLSHLRRTLLQAAVLFSAAGMDAASPPDLRIIGYVWRPANIERIDATKLTHINYAFAKVRGDDNVVFEELDAPANIARLRELKRVNPDLKIILSIGGWGAEWFSDAALTEESRCRFAGSAIELLRQHELDGLDIDWEYPGQPGAGNRFRAEDKQNFTLLLKAVRAELDLLSDGHGRRGARRYTLSIASSGGRYFDHTEMDRVHRYLDWINVMTYDFAAGWSKTTGHHTALHARATPGPSTEAFVRQHLAAGIPPEKIVVGVPFYGKAWRWVNRKSASGLYEPYDLFAGDVSYARLQREFLSDERYEHCWDSAVKAPYLWDGEVGTFVSYDDPRSLREKARFIKKNRLGGVMYWEHSLDPDELLLNTLYAELRKR